MLFKLQKKVPSWFTSYIFIFLEVAWVFSWVLPTISANHGIWRSKIGGNYIIMLTAQRGGSRTCSNHAVMESGISIITPYIKLYWRCTRAYKIWRLSRYFFFYIVHVPSFSPLLSVLLRSTSISFAGEWKSTETSNTKVSSKNKMKSWSLVIVHLGVGYFWRKCITEVSSISKKWGGLAPIRKVLHLECSSGIPTARVHIALCWFIIWCFCIVPPFCSWYYGSLTRREARVILQDFQGGNGSFLVRSSESFQGKFAVSFV